MGVLDGRTAVVTGAGRGIGREEALDLAAQGAAVVVNDLKDGGAGSPADDVVAEIRSAGGRAVAHYGDVTTVDGADELIQQAIDEFGDIDILVNNAGIVRDGMLFSIDPREWEAVVDIHLLGHFLPTRAAARHWRQASKAGVERPRSMVCTSSESGLFGNASQSNYDAAKLGIVSFTVAAARELGRYGVRANAIAPRARTRMTVGSFEGSARAAEFAAPAEGFDVMDPANIAPFVTFLASDQADGITAQAFIVYGGAVARVRLPHVDTLIMNEGRWSQSELQERVPELFANFPPDQLEAPKGYASLPRQG